MKYLYDLHTHTVMSGHAYSTLLENIAFVRDLGMPVYGFSDHNEGLPGAPDNIYFSNFKVLPRKISGVLVLRGAEVNILDYEGHYSLKERWARGLDYIIASLHNYAYVSGTVEQNTAAVLGAMDDPFVRIIGHPDDSRFPIDFETVVKAAAEKDILLELNNSSLKPATSRVNTYENNLEILRLCVRYGTRIVLGSDAHFAFDIGDFTEADALLRDIKFPEELIANLRVENLKWIIGEEKYQLLSSSL